MLALTEWHLNWKSLCPEGVEGHQGDEADENRSPLVKALEPDTCGFGPLHLLRGHCLTP